MRALLSHNLVGADSLSVQTLLLFIRVETPLDIKASVQKSNTMDIFRSACKGTTSRIFQKQMLHKENQRFLISPDFPCPHLNFHLIPIRLSGR